MTRALKITNGHATGNDFAIFSDPDGAIDLSEAEYHAISGLAPSVGVDGVIRVVRTENHPDGRAIVTTDPDAEWFMDHRNRDGSVAAVCGNALRVFVAYLMSEGLVSLEQNDRIAIATRDGVKDVQVGSNGTFRADLGRWRLREASAEPKQAANVVSGTSNALDSITIEPANPIVDDGIGRIGIHQNDDAKATPSWATAAVAAALETRRRLGVGAPHNWRVDMPDGSLGVQMFPTEDGEHVSISGPAAIGSSAVVEF